jgi:hypothetical protein
LWAALETDDRSRVDDRGAFLHVRQNGLGHVEIAEDIGAEGFVQPLLGDFVDLRGVQLECGVVDQDVDAAEGRHRFLRHLFAERLVADIAGDEDRLATFLLDMALGLQRVLVFVQICDDDIGAFAGIKHRNGAPDAGIAAGDDGDLASQLLAATIVGRGE